MFFQKPLNLTLGKLLAAFAFLLPFSIEAFNIQQEGNPYEKNGVYWTPMKITTDTTEITIDMPGNPNAFFSENYCGVRSFFMGNFYECNVYDYCTYFCGPSAPSSAEEFLLHVQEGTKYGKADIQLVENDNPLINYVVRCTVPKVIQSWYIIGQNGCFYVINIWGKRPLADVFESFVINR